MQTITKTKSKIKPLTIVAAATIVIFVAGATAFIFLPSGPRILNLLTNTPTPQVEAPTAPQSDLVIRDVTFDSFGVPSIIIGNAGSLDVPPATFGIQWTWMNNNGRLPNGGNATNFITPGIPSNGSAQPFALTKPDFGVTQIEIIINTGVVINEGNTTNNSRVVTVPTLMYPDLTPRTVTYDATTRKASVSIVNLGNSLPTPTPQIPLRWRWQRVLQGTTNTIRTEEIQNIGDNTAMGPGQSVNVNLDTPPSDATYLEITANANHTNKESAWDNNTITDRIATADLVPRGVTFDQTTGAMTITMANQGSIVIPANQVFNMDWAWLDNNGPLPNGGNSTNFVTGIVNGGIATYNANIPRYGTTRVQVNLNSNNMVAEINKENNLATFPVPVVPVPDIVPQSISFNATSRIPSIRIQNQGNGSVPTNTDFNIRWWWKTTTSTLSGPHTLYRALQGNGITPGGEYNVPLTNTAPYGATTLEIELDSEHRVNESNPNNNIGRFDVWKPDITIERVTYERDRTPTVQLKNQGRISIVAGQVFQVYWVWMNNQGYISNGGNSTNFVDGLNTQASGTIRLSQPPSTATRVQILINGTPIGAPLDEMNMNNNTRTESLPAN